jgi:hypothetical protein
MVILGWIPQTDIRDGIIKTIKYLENNPEILGRE